MVHSLIPALGGQRQIDFYEFRARLVYIEANERLHCETLCEEERGRGRGGEGRGREKEKSRHGGTQL